MSITRRVFLKHCATCAGAIGLAPLGWGRLEAALTSKAGPTIVWLHGSGCQGDSISFLNRIDPAADAGQQTADDILIHSVDLAYHTVLMASAGVTAVGMAQEARARGGYILALEGGVPRAFGGRACQVWSHSGRKVTYEQAVVEFAAHAQAIVCIGTCACFGGISRAGANPTDVVSIQEATGKSVINLPGCPAHPDWITWAIVQLLLGNPVPLDVHDRPVALYGRNVHDHCPRLKHQYATTLGQDHRCLLELGCRGKTTQSDCPGRKWNNAVNWCVDANGLCLGCTEPAFPGEGFYS
ncbi:MAG: hydrogenase small subunit [Planctomycetes bacterium]|jgi:NiFe hydrogenase small subunit HydA|nr:hydrogenase small subunit [Planctomycetota bacterium]